MILISFCINCILGLGNQILTWTCKQPNAAQLIHILAVSAEAGSRVKLLPWSLFGELGNSLGTPWSYFSKGLLSLSCPVSCKGVVSNMQGHHEASKGVWSLLGLRSFSLKSAFWRVSFLPSHTTTLTSFFSCFCLVKLYCTINENRSFLLRDTLSGQWAFFSF